MGKTHYADCRVDVRIYFDDNGEDDLRDQAIEALADRNMMPDDEGDCENNGAEVLCVEAVRSALAKENDRGE